MPGLLECSCMAIGPSDAHWHPSAQPIALMVTAGPIGANSRTAENGQDRSFRFESLNPFYFQTKSLSVATLRVGRDNPSTRGSSSEHVSFTLNIENKIMGGILDEKIEPEAAAKPG